MRLGQLADKLLLQGENNDTFVRVHTPLAAALHWVRGPVPRWCPKPSVAAKNPRGGSCVHCGSMRVAGLNTHPRVASAVATHPFRTPPHFQPSSASRGRVRLRLRRASGCHTRWDASCTGCLCRRCGHVAVHERGGGGAAEDEDDSGVVDMAMDEGDQVLLTKRITRFDTHFCDHTGCQGRGRRGTDEDKKSAQRTLMASQCSSPT